MISQMQQQQQQPCLQALLIAQQQQQNQLLAAIMVKTVTKMPWTLVYSTFLKFSYSKGLRYFICNFREDISLVLGRS